MERLVFPKKDHPKSNVLEVRRSFDFPKAWIITEDEYNWYLIFRKNLFEKYYTEKREENIFNVGWSKESIGPIKSKFRFSPPNFWR